MKMMETKSQYSEITIDIFLNLTGALPFDVFIKLGHEKFTKIFNRNDKVDRTRFEAYFKKGVKSLYINNKDRREYIGATERYVKKLLSAGMWTLEEATLAFEELAEQTLFEIYDDDCFDEHSLRRAQEVTKGIVNLAKLDPRVMTSFIQLCRNETYPVRHSIATTIFSILLARSAGDSNDKTLQIIGLGALLHDIGMAQLPPEICDADRQLSNEEFKEVKRHPALGAAMTEGIPAFPLEVKLVVTQHHESWDGRGYPNGMKGEEIYYPARVVAIADCFSALTTRRGGRALYSPQDAVAILSTEKDRYDPKLLEAFATLLTPKKKAA